MPRTATPRTADGGERVGDGALPTRLHPADIEALAAALAAEMARPEDDAIPEGAEYVTVEQLARRYQVSEKWVNSRADKLGATPISDAKNSKRRFHLHTADTYMASRREPTYASPPRVRRARKTNRRPTHTPSGAPIPDFI